MSLNQLWSCGYIISILGILSVVNAQSGTWGAGNGAGAGSWSNAQTGGMHPPGSLGSSDPQFSYGYAGVDSRGPYGGAGGNGGYYVSGTDEHGRPYNYNGGAGQIPPPGYGGRNDYRGGYGYGSSGAASLGLALTSLSVGVAVAWLSRRLCDV